LSRKILQEFVAWCEYEVGFWMNLSRPYISISFSNQRQLFGNWQLLLFNQSTVWAGLPTIYYPYNPY
jgi:hypothetical protein